MEQGYDLAQVESKEVADHWFEVEGLTFLVDDLLKRYLQVIQVDYSEEKGSFLIGGE